jgi:hypothetical protein
LGVHFNIYCIPKDPLSVPWTKILEALTADSMVRAPYRAGSPYSLLLGELNLRTPENFFPIDDGPDAPQQFELIDHAVEHVDQKPNAMIAAEALAAPLRRDPQYFYSHPADLGLYRFRNGHKLTVGQPEDWSDLADKYPDLVPASAEPRWRGDLVEFLWIHGKNAPLESDFLGSAMHILIETFWPAHTVLADEFL